jgi:hypothetical protein
MDVELVIFLNLLEEEAETGGHGDALTLHGRRQEISTRKNFLHKSAFKFGRLLTGNFSLDNGRLERLPNSFVWCVFLVKASIFRIYAHIPGFSEKSLIWKREIYKETKVMARSCVSPDFY